MKSQYWSFLAGMMFMTAIIIVEMWGLMPRSYVVYDSSPIVDLRAC
jgi:hypothetical protein